MLPPRHIPKQHLAHDWPIWRPSLVCKGRQNIKVGKKNQKVIYIYIIKDFYSLLFLTYHLNLLLVPSSSSFYLKLIYVFIFNMHMCTYIWKKNSIHFCSPSHSYQRESSPMLTQFCFLMRLVRIATFYKG